jgi:hypothetical protein
MSRARDVASNGGLVLTKVQTIGSAVSSVVVNSAFTAEFDNYKILLSGGVASANSLSLSFQLNGITSSYYGNILYSNYTGSGINTIGTNNGSSLAYCGVANTLTLGAQIDVNDPFQAKQKMISATFHDSNNAGRISGLCASNVSASGFTLTLGSGTMTGGTIRVYGYRNA